MLNGLWYPEGSSKKLDATLSSDKEDNFTLKVDEEIKLQGAIDSLLIESRVGNIKRKIILNDNSIFVTSDTLGVDNLKKEPMGKFLHYFESHILLVAISFVMIVVSSVSFVKWGIPYISQKIAYSVPYKASHLISKHSIKFLDSYIFKKSNLSTKKMNSVKKHFKNNLLSLDKDTEEIEYKLHFRSWNTGSKEIPNAMALPSGDIVLTDKFIELCQNQEEMDSVILHEMGHVHHRHSLTMLVQSTFFTVITVIIIGDSNGLVDMGVGLGSLLINSSYSRDYELEADIFAFDKMILSKKDPNHFSNIMSRMTEYMDSRDLNSNKPKDASSSTDLTNYLSSHPSTQSRIEMANRYSECFKKGKADCH